MAIRLWSSTEELSAGKGPTRTEGRVAGQPHPEQRNQSPHPAGQFSAQLNLIAFDDLLIKDRRADMLINLQHGQPIRFGSDNDKGVVMGSDGQLRIVSVAEVGEAVLLVHDEHRAEPSLAFALARLSPDVHSPTPMGVFRAVERREYAGAVAAQLAEASALKGRGDLGALLTRL